MDGFLAVLIGFLGALMMTMNGELGRGIGSLPGNLAVHASGLVLASAAMALAGAKPRLPRGTRPTRLSGGALGFASVLLVNRAFPALGVSLTLGLSLLGQAAASVIVDATGALWAERRPFRPRTAISLGLIAAGIAAMSAAPSGSAAAGGIAGAASALSAFLAGLGTIAGRRVNARLAADSDAATGLWWNYAVGTACAAIALLAVLAAGSDGAVLVGSPTDAAGHWPNRPPLWSWFGGAVGLAFVALSNRVTPRIGAYTMSLLVFLGQVGGSLVIEAALRGRLETGKLVGGAFILAGLLFKNAPERPRPCPRHPCLRGDIPGSREFSHGDTETTEGREQRDEERRTKAKAAARALF